MSCQGSFCCNMEREVGGGSLSALRAGDEVESAADAHGAPCRSGPESEAKPTAAPLSNRPANRSLSNRSNKLARAALVRASTRCSHSARLRAIKPGLSCFNPLALPDAQESGLHPWEYNELQTPRFCSTLVRKTNQRSRGPAATAYRFQMNARPFCPSCPLRGGATRSKLLPSLPSRCRNRPLPAIPEKNYFGTKNDEN